MPRLTTAQRNTLGAAVSKHRTDERPWSPELEGVCKEIADQMLRGNRKAMGLRAGRPRREVLMSSDYLDQACHKLRKRSA